MRITGALLLQSVIGVKHCLYSTLDYLSLLLQPLCSVMFYDVWLGIVEFLFVSPLSMGLEQWQIRLKEIFVFI